MVGGFSRPKKDKRVKVTEGEPVKTGQILVRGLAPYKAGKNVKGQSNLHALCNGKVRFTKKKTSHGRLRTFLNVEPK